MYHSHLHQVSKENQNFRQVLATFSHCQLVVMSLKPGENIGMEIHPKVDQILYFTQGEGMSIVDGKESKLIVGDVICIPAGSEHNIINTGILDMKLFTIYSPSNHPDGTIHATKDDAIKNDRD